MNSLVKQMRWKRPGEGGGILWSAWSADNTHVQAYTRSMTRKSNLVMVFIIYHIHAFSDAFAFVFVEVKAVDSWHWLLTERWMPTKRTIILVLMAEFIFIEQSSNFAKINQMINQGNIGEIFGTRPNPSLPLVQRVPKDAQRLKFSICVALMTWVKRFVE